MASTDAPGLAAFADRFGLAVKNTKDTKAVNGETVNGETVNGETVNGSSKSETPPTPPTPKTEEDSDTQPKPDAGPKPEPGSLISYAAIYREDEDKTWTSTQPDDVEPAENEETAAHAIVLRHQKSTDSRKKYEIHSLVIQSPQLKDALDEILKDYPGVFCKLDRLIFDAPFEPFVHRWGNFLKYMASDLDPTTKKHIELLHSILKRELRDTLQAFEDYVANGVLTYDLAWTIFQPGAIILTSTGLGTARALKFGTGRYVETRCGKAYRLWCNYIDWDGKSFGWARETADLPEFKGTKLIKDLPVLPLAFHSRKALLRRSLISRGRTFENLAGYHYKSYDGIAIEKTRDGPSPIQLNSRIIIDTSSWNRQRDQDTVYVDALTSSDANETLEKEAEEGQDGPNDSTWDGTQLFKLEKPEKTDQSDKDDSSESKNPLTDYQRLLCSPIVHGYSLKSKKWLSFLVETVKEIQWNSAAFDSLVLPQEQKQLILALSKSQAAALNIFDDVIEGKGKGMIILLSGPPGVGKTLTAESVSENMRVPLYMMSAGDLGIRPDEVEENLEEILSMVARWKAILLIDECDVFLEERSVHDLERNKLVSIFLRLLEYYQGTLFLTTNRVGNIDSAFQSRIHVHMAYPDLNAASRRQIWSNFISRLNFLCNISPAELDKLAEVPINGRQIKNLIKTAQLLALEEQRALCKKHVDIVLAIEKGGLRIGQKS